jgi:hypothetical protein
MRGFGVTEGGSIKGRWVSERKVSFTGEVLIRVISNDR